MVNEDAYRVVTSLLTLGSVLCCATSTYVCAISPGRSCTTRDYRLCNKGGCGSGAAEDIFVGRNLLGRMWLFRGSLQALEFRLNTGLYVLKIEVVMNW